MHWSSQINECLNQKKATEDIATFKICRLNSATKEAYPFHYPFKDSYKVGKQYIIDANVVEPVGNSIYHGYKTYDESKDMFVVTKENKVCVVSKDTSTPISFYGCRTFPPMSTIVMKCVVPKGAIYYENEFGEIVSNQIKVQSFNKL